MRFLSEYFFQSQSRLEQLVQRFMVQFFLEKSFVLADEGVGDFEEVGFGFAFGFDEKLLKKELCLVVHLCKQQSIALCLDLRNDMLMVMKVALCKGFLIFSHGQVISVEFESECRYMSINESDDVLG
jgi:hypothetical protein